MARGWHRGHACQDTAGTGASGPSTAGLPQFRGRPPLHATGFAVCDRHHSHCSSKRRIRRIAAWFARRPGLSAWLVTTIRAAPDSGITTTDATHELGKARTRLVLKAFLETYYSSIGFSGYRGYEQPDGTRYGGDLGERWCSEYYSFVANTQLAGVGHRSNVTKVIDYFQEYGAYASVSDPNEYMNSAERGDYVAMDTNIDGTKNHSALFLAYDVATKEIWTADGNSSGGIPYGGRYAGNEAILRRRSPDVVRGWGQIVYDMLLGER